MTNTQYDLITFGETMLRLSPPSPLRLGQSSTLDMNFGGAESNVASNLARLGRRVSWWSRLPENPVGHQLAETLRGHAVKVDDVTFSQNERLGTYYVEFGTPPRGIRVWYDRANSAASHIQPADLPAGWISSGKWLHLTGITPALSDSCHQTVAFAIKTAQDSGVKVSFDVNYRALLWTPEEAARQITGFCQRADVVFVAKRDAASLFGVDGEIESVVTTLQSQWGGTVIVTSGESGAVASDGNTVHSASAIPVQILDRLGAGDAFASGVLDRLIDDAPLDEALRFGTALAAVKLTIAGDIAHTSRAEVEQLLNNSHTQLRR
ncbi:MAG: sugar kinase [Aggregatilineales bacterium]